MFLSTLMTDDKSSSSSNRDQEYTGPQKTNSPERPLISIITVSFNSIGTIKQAIDSVQNQSYENIEHLVIDGGSSDGTIDVIRQYSDKLDYWSSAPDKGIYDAMNQGLAIANGEYIGFLNSDDYFSGPHVIREVVDEICRSNADAVFSCLDIVDSNDTAKVLRRCRIKHLSRALLRIGIMPPHPTFYCRKSIYNKVGPYRTDYSIAADFEMMVRLMIRGGITWSFIDFVSVIMRTGGVSNRGITSKTRLNFEIVRGCRENGLYTNHLLLLLKLPVRLAELLR